MLVILIASGVIPLAGLEPGLGIVDLPAENMVTVTRRGGTAVIAGLPLGAPEWPQPLDASDEAWYGWDWTSFLPSGRRIAAIERVAMSAVGASLGVQIGANDERPPTLDEEGRKVMVTLSVDPAYQTNAAFSGTGTKVSIALLIETDATPPDRFERSGIVTVRQQ